MDQNNCAELVTYLKKPVGQGLYPCLLGGDIRHALGTGFAKCFPFCYQIHYDFEIRKQLISKFMDFVEYLLILQMCKVI